MIREKAIEEIKNYENYPNGLSKECRDYIIKALEQETVLKESYDHEYFLRKEFEIKIARLEQQEPIIDKIRAEIEQITSRYSISRERGGMGQVEWSDYLIKESEVLEIIDKYKAESENP